MTKGQNDKWTKGQKDKKVKGQKDKIMKRQEVKGQGDKSAKRHKDKRILKHIFEVLCCILGTCTFLLLVFPYVSSSFNKHDRAN